MLTYPWHRAEIMRNTPDFTSKSAQNAYKQKITVADIVSTTVTDLAWVNRIDTFGNSWKTGLFGVINCYQASSGQILCQNTYSFHLDYSMHKEKTQHFYFKLSFSTSPFFAGLLTLLPLPLEEFFGSTFFRVIEVFSHPAVFLVDFRNDTIG